jgi:pimeloyl-ACP methyl ester carboxylesterase
MPPTLVFLPGTLCDARVWEPVMRELTAQWPCQFIDYGLDDRIGAMATRALNETTGTLISIGHSMGGMVAIDMWRQASERIAAIALFDVVADAENAEKARKRQAMLLHASGGEARTFRSVIETELVPNYAPPPFSLLNNPPYQLVVEMAVTLGVDVFAAQSQALGTRQDAWRQLASITVPSLIVRGERDPLCTSDHLTRMQSLLPEASLAVIQNVGHFTPLEASAEVSRYLREWLHAFRPAD